MRLTRILFAAFAFAAILLFCGCDVRIDTRMEIEKDFSGVRTMTCVLTRPDEDAMEQAGALTDYFAERCPEELDYRLLPGEGEDGEDLAEFTLSFHSRDEYLEKVETLLDREAKVEMIAPDSVFVSGVDYSEDFKSADLLKWIRDEMDDAAEDFPLEKKAYVSFRDGENILAHGGEEYDSSGRFHVRAIKSAPPDHLRIETQAFESGSYERSVSCYVPRDIYLANGGKIRDFMSGLQPENAQGVWSDYDGGKVFRVNFQADGPADLLEKTKISLASANCALELGEGEGRNPLKDYTVLLETLDFSAFSAGSRNGVRSEYSFVSPDNRPVETFFNGYRDYQIDGTFCEEAFSENVISVGVTMGRAFVPEAVKSDTRLLPEGQVEKTITVLFPEGTTEEAAARLKSYFEAVGLPGTEADYDAGTEKLTFRVMMSGAPQDVTQGLAACFGYGNFINYERVKKSGTRIETLYEEQMDLSRFLEMMNYEGPVQFAAAPSRGEKLDDVTLEYAGGKKEEELSGKIAVELSGGSVHAGYRGHIVPITGILLLVTTRLLALAALAAGYCALCCRIAVSHHKRDLPFREKMRYGTKYVGYTLAGLGDAFSPEDARPESVHYFFGSKWPLWMILAALLNLPAIILAFPIWLFKPLGWTWLLSALHWLGGMLSGILLPAGVLMAVWERFRSRRAFEEALDAFLQDERASFEERALSRFGLVREQVSFTKPLVLTGPYPEKKRGPVRSLSEALSRLHDCIKDQFVYRPHQKYKQGADGKVRYSLIQVNIYHFGQRQLFVYELGYDLCTCSIFRESTAEYFYQDIDFVSAGEQLKKILGRRSRMIEKRYESFKIVAASGSYNYTVTDADEKILENQVMAMRNLLREQKERAAAIEGGV